MEQPPPSTTTEQSSTLSPAVEMFSKELTGIINDEDMKQMKERQQNIFSKMNTSRQKLSDFNDRMEKEFVEMSKEYSKHQGMLREMKSDLEYIMRKIRSLQNKFGEEEEQTIVTEDSTSIEVKPKQFS